LRGGAFNLDPVNVRSTDRIGQGPANRNFFTGFRPARTFR
jgi:hypothetical protein